MTCDPDPGAYAPSEPSEIRVAEVASGAASSNGIALASVRPDFGMGALSLDVGGGLVLRRGKCSLLSVHYPQDKTLQIDSDHPACPATSLMQKAPDGGQRAAPEDRQGTVVEDSRVR
jgi:hypothetical protein